MGAEPLPFSTIEFHQFSTLIGSRIQEGKLELPVLPQVATRVIQAASDEQANAAQLAQLLHSDQSLAVQVLRAANSVALGGRQKIVSLQQAVARLGRTLLTEIAVSVALKNGVFKGLSGSEWMVQLWKESLAAGVFAREIARLRRANVESAFLGGLLHGVGRPIVLLEAHRRSKEEKLKLPADAFESVMTLHHQRAGRMAVQAWRLPPFVAEVITHYHDYRKAPDPELTGTVALAGQLSRQLQQAVADQPAEFPGAVFPELNIYPDQLLVIYDQGQAQVQQMEASLL